jgi:ureidoglycolate lyase
MIIYPKPLTSEAFRRFGEVLETRSVTAELINEGHTQKFADLANVTLGNRGRVQVSIYRSRAIELPFRIRNMERHPLGSQAFFPLHNRPFPVVVAPAEAIPGPETIRVFLSDGQQGVNINPGVWHHYQLTLDRSSDYIVIDRYGKGENREDFRLEKEILLDMPHL